MILDINNPECKNEIMLWAKAKGLLLAKTHQMPISSNAYVIRNKEELNSIKDQLPEKFCMRADYRLGNNAVKVNLAQREIRINSLLKEDLGNNMQEKAKREFLETKIPKEYRPISHGRMQEIKDKIIFPLMNAKDLQYQYKEYIAMCNIEHGEIRVAEIYRSERHLNKEYNIR